MLVEGEEECIPWYEEEWYIEEKKVCVVSLENLDGAFEWRTTYNRICTGSGSIYVSSIFICGYYVNVDGEKDGEQKLAKEKNC